MNSSIAARIELIAAFVRERNLLALTYGLFVGLILVTPFGYSFRWTFYAFVIPCFVLAADRATLEAIARSWVWRFAMLLLAYMWLSLLWAEQTKPSDYFNYGRRAGMIALFLTMTAALMQAPRFARQLFRWLFAVAALMALATLLTLSGDADIWMPEFRTGTLTILNPNVAAAIYGVLLVGSLFYVLRTSKGRLQTAVWAAALVVCIVLIVLTKSRGNWIAFATTMLFLMMLTNIRALIVVLAATVVAAFSMWASGLLDVGHLFVRGDSYRLESWEYFYKIWREAPLLGVGVNMNTIFNSSVDNMAVWHAHNIYLSYLSQGGIVGLLLLLAMLGAALRTAYRAARENQDFALIGMLTYVMVYGLIDFPIFIENVGWQWLFFWLPLGLIAGAEARFGVEDRAAPTIRQTAPNLN